jgi:hypothetical protein
MAKIFLSYSYADTERSRQLIDDLTNALRSEKGVEVWNDRKITAGETWTEVIEKQLEQATTFVLVLSPAYLDSIYTAFEMGVAMSRRSQGKAQVVPVLVRDINTEDLPLQLRRRTIIDARGKSAKEAARLVADEVQRSEREGGT